MREFVTSTILVSFMSNLLPLLKLKPETEIFPKQTHLPKDSETGKLRPGQFINLPYYKKTERKAINPQDGTYFTFEQFIEVVEQNSKKEEDLARKESFGAFSKLLATWGVA